MFIWTQFIDQLPVGLLAQLVERCTGIAEVMGSNPVRAWNFFQVLFTTTRSSSVLSCEDLLISTSQYFVHFRDSKTFQTSYLTPCVEAILASIGFISILSIKAWARTIHTFGKRSFPACHAIYEHFNLFGPSGIYGGCDRPQDIDLLSSNHLLTTSLTSERKQETR